MTMYLNYWSKLYCEQLKIGDEYKKLWRTICINIVDFEATESKKYHSIYRLKELEEGAEENKIENAKNLLDILDDKTISERLKLDLNIVKDLREHWQKEQSIDDN